MGKKSWMDTIHDFFLHICHLPLSASIFQKSIFFYRITIFFLFYSKKALSLQSEKINEKIEYG